MIKHIIGNNLYRDSSFALFGNIYGRGLSLVSGILVARLLSKEVFGEYATIKETMTNMGLIAAFGLGYIGTQKVAENIKRNKDNIETVNQITKEFSIGISIVCLIIVGLTGRIWINYLELSISPIIFLFAALIIVFNAINNVQTGIMSGLKLFKSIAINTSIAGTATLITTLILCYFFRLQGAIVALIISNGIICTLNACTLSHKIPTVKKNCSRHKNQLRILLLKRAFPIALNESLYIVLHWCGIVFLIKCYTIGENGIFNIAMVWTNTILFIPSSIRSVALSYLSSSIDDNKKLLSILLKINIISTVIPLSMVLLLSNVIVGFYGPTYSGLKTVLCICVSTTLFRSISILLSQRLIAQKENWLLFISACCRDLCIVGFSILMYKIKVNFSGATIFSINTFIFQALYMLFLIAVTYAFFLKTNDKSKGGKAPYKAISRQQVNI